MVIYEHVKGVISVPCYDDNGNYAGYTNDITFTENDIIKDSCSITSRACDDNTFSLGGVRPAELSIKLRLEGDGINAYNLYGAKIILYSCYAEHPKESDWVFRGTFWVTSVSRIKTMYTLRASDATVWLDSGSYSGSGTNVTEKNAKTAIDAALINVHRTLGDSLRTILELTNVELTNLGVDNISLYEFPESKLAPHDLKGIFRNNSPEYPTDDVRMWGILDQNDGYFNTRTPGEYASAIAEMYCGFISGRNYMAYNDTSAGTEIQIVPFGYCNPDEGYGVVSISYDEIESDTLDMADYQLFFQNIYVKTFDETGWASYSTPKKFGGNITIDLTDNPFLDGRHHGMLIYDSVHNTKHSENPDCNVFEVTNTLGAYITSLKVRPFKLKCHKSFSNWKDYPKVGMKIQVEEKDGTKKESIITKTIWKFHGGWELGCSGSDSRVLSQAAKKSLSSHAENSAKTYASTLASRLDTYTRTENANRIENIKSSDQMSARNMRNIQQAFLSIGVDFTYEETEWME